MDQVDLVILELAGDDETVGLFALGVLHIIGDIFTLDESLIGQGRLETLGVVVQRRMGHNLGLTDPKHFGRSHAGTHSHRQHATQPPQ